VHVIVPPPFHWPEALVYWGIHLWAFVPELRLARRGAREAGAEDAGSLRRIVWTVQLSYLVALALALQPRGRMGADRPVLAAACLLLIAGGLLRRACFQALGEDFSGAVRTRVGQRVVDAGPYRWVRHPSYVAAITMLTGCGLALGNWASALVMLLATAVVYRWRAVVEERALLAALGEDYRAYAAVTPRFLPRLGGRLGISRSGR